MPALLTASSCPAVQAWNQVILVNTTMDTTAKVAKNVPANVTFRQQVNQNAALLDLLSRGGGGLIGVMDGVDKITLSFPVSGLLLQISAGHAMIGGPVEIAAATTLAVPNNTPRIWIWLLQNGALTFETTLAAPAGECCLLGSCATLAGSITSIDTSGVIYLRGGVGWRQTADGAAPTDTPPSSVQFVASTAGGSYWWDGTSYFFLGARLAALVASASTSADVSDRLDAMERKHRALLLALVRLFGSAMLPTSELVNDLQRASREA